LRIFRSAGVPPALQKVIHLYHVTWQRLTEWNNSGNEQRKNMGDLLIREFRISMRIAPAILALSAMTFSLFALGTSAQKAELRVMISDGMKTVVEEVTPQIEQSTGRKLAAQFNSSKNLRDKIQAGEPFDVAILTSDVLDDLIKQGKIAPGGRSEISRSGLGVGVRAGAAKPDISTPEALKRTLLNARSISFNPTGASATHTYDMFAGMGITDAMKPKLKLDAEAGRPQMNVTGGKTELVISLIPEIKFFPGVELVGPIPSEFQSYIYFAGGIATSAHDAEASKALLKFIAGPAVLPVLKAKGMEPR
jgi:molybdate transport system substrate-binding protein